MSDAQLEANWRDWRLENDGLLDPGQPTESSTVTYQREMRQRLFGSFTAEERMAIRCRLELGVPDVCE